MRLSSAFLKAVVPAVLIAIANPFSSARADDCPTGSLVDRAFAVERGGGSKLSVFHLADGIVRTIYRAGGATILETTEFQGLFPLERIDRGRRKTFRPQSDLKPLFPLKAGKKINVTFDTEQSGQSSSAAFELLVKNMDALYIGPCKYAVFQIEKSEGRDGKPPSFVNVDYYSAELKMIIAKEYRDNGRASTWIKYDKIYSIDR